MRKNFEAKPWFYPLPVLIIGTYDENQNPVAMNAAWGGLYDADKVALCLSAGHKTTSNIRLNEAFTVSFADVTHVVACDYVGLVSANTESEKIKKAGFTTTKSEYINAPIINELPVTLECELIKFNEDGNVIGKIVNISVDDSVLDASGKIDMEKFKPISFDPVHNVYRTVSENVGAAFQVGNKLK